LQRVSCDIYLQRRPQKHGVMLRQTQVFKVSLSDLFWTLSGKFVGRVDKDHFFDRFGM
jgi:hypothetical protein